MPPRHPAPPSAIHLPPRQARALAAPLLAWYDAAKRDLPWRHTSDPYAILVSEFMLQQTQVATVIPYYERFLKAFPSVEALAAADEQEVLRLWAGLGYYTRARNLQAAAQKIVAEYGGRVPERIGDLLFLPGVGAYVAGAVASIAYGVAAPAIDANVNRVICRLFALAENPAAPKIRREIESVLTRLIPPERPGDFNQALMELGALICPAAAPQCEVCPWNPHCEARKKGRPEDYPALPPRQETVAVEEACALVRDGGEYLLARRPDDGGRYRGFWEFPTVEIHPENPATPLPAAPALPSREPSIPARDLLKTFISETYGISIEIESEWAEIKHQVTHHKIRKRIFTCRLASSRKGEKTPGKPQIKSGMVKWVSLPEIHELPLSAPNQRVLELLEGQDSLFAPLT